MAGKDGRERGLGMAETLTPLVSEHEGIQAIRGQKMLIVIQFLNEDALKKGTKYHCSTSLVMSPPCLIAVRLFLFLPWQQHWPYNLGTGNSFVVLSSPSSSFNPCMSSQVSISEMNQALFLG